MGFQPTHMTAGELRTLIACAMELEPEDIQDAVIVAHAHHDNACWARVTITNSPGRAVGTLMRGIESLVLGVE